MDAEKLILEASETGNLDDIRRAISKDRTCVNTARDSDGRTALHTTSENGHSEVVKELIAAGANVDVQNKNGATALWIASQNGHSAVVKEFIAAGASVDAQNKNGDTALWIASQNGCSVVKELIAAGADLDVQGKNGGTALWIASQNGCSVVKELIAAGADLDVQGKSGATALYVASQNGHSAVVKELIAAGANLDVQIKDGATALYVASQNGHSAVVKELIAAGVNLDVQFKRGATALFVASRKGHSEVVKELIAAGANLHVQKEDDWTALHAASQNGHSAVVKDLIAAGANLSVQANDGRTALALARLKGHSEVVKDLISAGADVAVLPKVAKIPQRTRYVAPVASGLHAEGKEVSPLASGRQDSAHAAPVPSAPPRTWIRTDADTEASTRPSGQVPPGPTWTQETEVAPAPSAPLRSDSAQAVPEDTNVPNTFPDQKPCLCPEYQREMFAVDTSSSGQLASGAFGAVYRGRIGEQSVAVKVIGGGRNDVARKEVSILHMIDHPHVSRVYGWHCDGTQTFLLLELLAESLEQRLKRAKKGASTTASRRPFLSWAEYYSICLGVLHGVGALHKHRCLHRDIKPQNIMLSSEGVAKLVDLGISKEEAAMSATGTHAGTFPYMAPEVLNGHPYSFPADMYSVGCTAWQLINGRTPWEWVTQPVFFAQHQASLPMDSIQATPTIAPGLVELIASMLKYNPGDRCTNTDAITKCQQLREQHVWSRQSESGSPPRRDEV
ncbi:hypothetical protein DIPPA_19608 [Diplonema papillatum]|nr:hypothetical protein DIPPA_19608 [Diplonema papillatum]